MMTALTDPLMLGIIDLQTRVLYWKDRLPPELDDLIERLAKLETFRAEELLRRRTQELSWDDLFE